MKLSNYWIDFLVVMTSKEVSARYKHAFFGFLWLFINPLSQMLIMGIIFQFFVPVKVDNYFLFLFSGLLPWNMFSISLNIATSAFFNQRYLIKKAKFPREIIVFSIVLADFFHFSVALAILLLVLVFDKLFIEHRSIMFLGAYLLRLSLVIPISLWLLSLTSSLSLLLASLHVKFRDIAFFVSHAVSIFFYATPILYSMSNLPDFIQPLLYLNPMTIIIETYHYSMLGIQIDFVRYGLVALVETIGIMILARHVYVNQQKDFDDWL